MEMTSTRTVTTFEMEGGSGGQRSVTRSGGSGGSSVTRSGGASVTKSGGSGEVSMQIIREGQTQVKDSPPSNTTLIDLFLF